MQQVVEPVFSKIPFSPKQLSNGVAGLEDIVAEHEAGIWTWEFRPWLHRKAGLPKVIARLKRTAAYAHFLDDTRDDILRLAPILSEDAFGHSPERVRWPTVQIGGTEILFFIVRGYLNLANLRFSLRTSQYVMVSGAESQGAHGAWVVRRGPCHPLVKAAEGIEAWYLARPDRGPLISKYKGRSVLRLYSSRHHAEIRSSPGTAPARADGAALLRILSFAESFALPDGTVFGTRNGVISVSV